MSNTNNIPGRCPNCLQQTDRFPCVNARCKWQEGLNNPPPFLPLGTILDGRYRIAMVLGQGGFGVTYLAWEENLQQRLAIKEYFPRDVALRSSHASDLLIYSGACQEFFHYGLERFLEEARILARFDQHPGIVSAKAFFRANGTGYVVMEYVDGITLRQYLDECPEKKLSFPHAATLLLPLMDALQKVHKEGLLHRDIAPDNIYITTGEQVKLLDFGAARFTTAACHQNIVPATSVSVTPAAHVNGRCGDTPRPHMTVILKQGYAPEEQYRSRGNQGPWSDVYGLAATLYRAITGLPPPDALDRVDRDELVPPSQLGVDILLMQEQVLLKGLAVKAQERFQAIADFQRALREEIVINSSLHGTAVSGIESNKKQHVGCGSDESNSTSSVGVHKALQTSIVEISGVLQILVTGRLDGATAGEFQQALSNLFMVPGTCALMDLTYANYIASAGLRVILMAAKRAKQSKSRLLLCGLQPHVREVFEISGFFKILEVVEDKITAMAKLKMWGHPTTPLT